MPASIKQTTPETADFSGWLLHFTRKFNLAIQSRFPGSRINVLFPLLIHMYNGFWKIAPLLQWPDRSGFAPDSLFLPAYSCQHLICSLWNYTDIILPPVTVFVNPLKGFLLFFYQPELLFTGNVPRGVFCEQSSQKIWESQREIMRMHDFCASRSVLLVTE